MDSLEAIYAEIPRLDCQQKCQGCCGPLLVPKIEHRRIEQAGKIVTLASLAHVELNSMWKWMGKENLAAMQPDGNMSCQLLMPITGRCTVYAIRPLICRIWGCIERMRCPHGCVPERWLTETEVRRMFEKILKLQRMDS
jgi:uncharacterized protein